jgi:hypothetical protein
MKIKNKTWLFLILLTGFLTGACKSSNSPGKAAEKFLNAFNERKYDEARKYATPETIKLVDLMENLSKMSEAEDSVHHPKIEVVDERIEGDTAFVTFRESGSEETEELKLIKTDGKWLVHLTKTDLSAKEDSPFDTTTQDNTEPDSGEAGDAIEDSIVSDTPPDRDPVSK